MFLGGMPKLQITHYLNDHGVLSPATYKQSKGLKYCTPNSAGSPMWSTITLDMILKNPVYVGDMAQGRYRMKSYKIHVKEVIPEEDWIVVENTHEPIIDRETCTRIFSTNWLSMVCRCHDVEVLIFLDQGNRQVDIHYSFGIGIIDLDSKAATAQTGKKAHEKTA